MSINIKKLSKYNNWLEVMGKSEDWISYISYNIHPDDMLLTLKLAFPEFIVIDECILLEHKFDPDNYKEWKEKFSNQYQKVEKIINHTHLYDIFDQCADHVDDSIFEEIAKILCTSWSQSLKLTFPNKDFIVEYFNNKQTYGPTLTFYQK